MASRDRSLLRDSEIAEFITNDNFSDESECSGNEQDNEVSVSAYENARQDDNEEVGLDIDYDNPIPGPSGDCGNVRIVTVDPCENVGDGENIE